MKLRDVIEKNLQLHGIPYNHKFVADLVLDIQDAYWLSEQSEKHCPLCGLPDPNGVTGLELKQGFSTSVQLADSRHSPHS